MLLVLAGSPKGRESQGAPQNHSPGQARAQGGEVRPEGASRPRSMLVSLLPCLPRYRPWGLHGASGPGGERGADGGGVGQQLGCRT